MGLVKLNDYGLNLSGRPLGIQSYTVIVNKYEKPFDLDFSNVFSVGSSFADEVVAKLAILNEGEIKIINANNIIKKCLNDVSKEKKFIVTYVDN